MRGVKVNFDANVAPGSDRGLGIRDEVGKVLLVCVE